MLLATNYWKALSHIQSSWCCQPDGGTQARQKHELALSLRSVEVQGPFDLIGLSLKTKKDWNVDPLSNRPQYISYGLKLHYRILASNSPLFCEFDPVESTDGIWCTIALPYLYWLALQERSRADLGQVEARLLKWRGWKFHPKKGEVLRHRISCGTLVSNFRTFNSVNIKLQ